jgi:hypothetical protein
VAGDEATVYIMVDRKQRERERKREEREIPQDKIHPSVTYFLQLGSAS